MPPCCMVQETILWWAFAFFCIFDFFHVEICVGVAVSQGFSYFFDSDSSFGDSHFSSCRPLDNKYLDFSGKCCRESSVEFFILKLVLGFPHRMGWYRPGGFPFSFPRCRSCRCVEGFRTVDGGPIIPGCAVAPMYEPQPTTDRPAVLGFPHRAGGCRSRRTPFSYTGCRSCRDTEGFMIRAWGPMLPGCAGSTRSSQSAIDSWDWGVHTVRGGDDPGSFNFRLRGVGVVEIWEEL